MFSDLLLIYWAKVIIIPKDGEKIREADQK